MTKLQPFDEVEQGPLDQRKIFAVRQDRVRSALSGRELRVDRLIAPDWVNVLAFSGDDMLFVRQWRFGSREFSLEIPAGCVEPGEEPLAAGLRELREETGCAPRQGTRALLLGSVKPNPAFMANRCFTVLVEDAAHVGAPEPDATEEIEMVRVPRREVADRVRDGTVDSALVLVAFHWLALHDATR